MASAGIICEYNPFHRGHLRQIELTRAALEADCGVVCLMSGNYVQRGAPAIFHKSLRAEAALRCGADLVLELPLTAALSSAEGFAAGGVRILSALGCEVLSFGAETEHFEELQCSAAANLDPAFDALLRRELESGCSYAAARQRALEALGAGKGVCSPNDILAVEYLKALLRQGSPMRPLPIHRTGSYHAQELDAQNPSAAALRIALSSTGRGGHRPPEDASTPACRGGHRPPEDVSTPACRGGHRPPEDASASACRGGHRPPEDASASACRGGHRPPEDVSPPACRGGHWPPEDASTSACRGGHRPPEDASMPVWASAVPSCLHDLYETAPLHSWQAGERAVLGILRTLPEAAFRALPFGAEGLWSKLMKNCRRCGSTEEIITQTLSKRYARTRIQRMLLCAVLGLRAQDLAAPASYVRILGFNDRGRAMLRDFKQRFPLLNAGEKPRDPESLAYYALEERAALLYDLFSREDSAVLTREGNLRPVYLP